ncbi:hypothetical protein WA158_003797 [Blastocystis sp. Blastoise]
MSDTPETSDSSNKNNYNPYQLTEGREYNYTLRWTDNHFIERHAKKTAAQKASWIIEYSSLAGIYAFFNTFFSVGAFIVFVLDFLLQNIWTMPLPIFYFSLSVSIFYTFDFFLTVYVNVDRCGYLFSKHGLLDFFTSVPMLILILIQWLSEGSSLWVHIIPFARVCIFLFFIFI